MVSSEHVASMGPPCGGGSASARLRRQPPTAHRFPLASPGPSLHNARPLMSAPSSTATTDGLGVAVSALCAVHCVAGALLVGSPALTGFITDERLEWALLVAALAIAAAAVGRGFRQHRNPVPLVLAVAALIPLSLAHGVPWTGEWAEVALSVAGASMLVTGHVTNLRAHRAHGHACRSGQCTHPVER